MSNVQRLRNRDNLVQTHRADFVHDALKQERWSVRQAAMALGMSPAALSSRTRAETAFLADELERIAQLLKRDPVEFYANYLRSGDGPVGPAGVEPTTSTVESRSSGTIIHITEAPSLQAHRHFTRAA